MKTVGPYVILRKQEFPFWQHFQSFWNRLPETKKQAAIDGLAHLAFNPGKKQEYEQHD